MKKSIFDFKVAKIIELSSFLALEIAFLAVLISNKTLRTSIFVDKSLFILCSLMYFTVLVTLTFLIFDFFKLRQFKVQNHDLENLAYLDRKTGIPNRTSVNLLFDTYKTKESMKGIGCVLSEISNIKEINEVCGKEAGDKVIKDFSIMYKKSAEGYGFVGRNGGNEFITVIEKCDEEKLKAFSDRLTAAIDAYNEKSEKGSLIVHSECVLFDAEEVNSFSELVARAYKKLGR